MRHHIQRLLSRGTASILLWSALVAVPPLVLAGGLQGYSIGTQPSQVGLKTTSVRTDMATACQTDCQATSTSVEVLRARLQAAQDADQLRALLDEVLQQQTAIQAHKVMCMEMMGHLPLGH